MKTPRQLELIEAAIKLTATDGIQKLTIRNVASAIGVSEAAVYRHFESKHELLKAILAYLDAMLSPRFEALLESKAPAFEALLSFLSDLFTLLEHNTAFTLMLFAEETFNVDPQLQTELLSLMEGNLARLVQFFQKAIEKGACRSDLAPLQLAVITFGSIRLSVSRWHLQGASTSLTNQATPIVNTLITLFSVM
ncbi:MAG: TetR/AcrR family transcriptional regulator [Spirochaetia bacterium]|nr:TetR/AcrR family transcriptional regulator [Spirochaetia bacterium]